MALRIKSNVDLKELEKLGFEKMNNIYRYGLKEVEGYVYPSVIYFYDYERIIKFYSCMEIEIEKLDILYDLIQLGLIERVGG